MEQFSFVDISEPDIPEPPAPATIPEERRREFNIFKQAMPLSRLLGNGMEYTDARALHDLADRGISWADAGEWLGQRNLHRARAAQEAGHMLSARSFYHYASACFRFGQVSLPGEAERKRDMYGRLIETFAAAGVLDDPPIQKVEVPYRGGAVCGWLMLPPVKEAPSVIIVVGGLDGWREEYYRGAQYLVERGIAALLVDVPGQGETRLFHRLYLTPEANQVKCALLQLHGALDTVCLLEIARPIYENAPSTGKQIIIWPDGVHCIYNHSHEKHSIMSDWFHDRLCSG